MSEFLAFAHRGRTEAWRYPAALALGLILFTVMGIALALGLGALGWLPPGLADQMRQVADPLVFFTATGVVFAALLAAFAAAFRLVQAKRFADIVGAWRWKGFAAGAGVWAAALIVLTLVDLALRPKGFSLSPVLPSPALILTYLLALGAQTFAEEFLFRGWLTQGLLLALRRPPVAALASGLLFGALHIPNGWPQAVNAAAFGVVLALIAIRTGGLAFGAGVHLVNNLFGAVVVVSSSDVFKGSPGLLVQSTPDLVWFDMAVGAAAMTLLALWVVRRDGPSGAAG